MGKLLVIHSELLEVFEVTSTTSAKTIAVPRYLSAAYGLPEQVVTDNGLQFTSDKFQAYMLNNTIQHTCIFTCCAPYHPASKHLAERFAQTFKQAMKASGKQGHSLSRCLLLTYQSTPHATTGVAPCKLFLQCEIGTYFDLLRPDCERNVCEKQTKQVAH